MDMRHEGQTKEGLPLDGDDWMWHWTVLGMVAPCLVGVELKACEELGRQRCQEGRREEET